MRCASEAVTSEAKALLIGNDLTARVDPSTSLRTPFPKPFSGCAEPADRLTQRQTSNGKSWSRRRCCRVEAGDARAVEDVAALSCGDQCVV